MNKDKIKEALQCQKMELATLITINAIETIYRQDKGQLNNLHRALKLNENALRYLQDEDIKQ